MIVLREMRRRAKVLVGPLLGIALTGYFAYHLVEGDRGLKAWVRLSQELQAARNDLAAVSAERARLAYRVSQMQPDHIDPDLLDQQVRKLLDVAAPNEIVIMDPPAAKGGTKAPPRP
jgi:cell division protein FtsB